MANGSRAEVVVVLALLLTLAAAPSRPEAAAETGWVRIGNPADRDAVERALRGARERLQGAECRLVFSDFKNADGRSLQEGLDTLGLSPEGYLGFVFFYDGFGQGRCMRSGIIATTVPGSRVVRTCGPRFTELSRQKPEEAQAVLLHEVLHTLGLGENPPTSAHITQRVVERCYPERVASVFAKARGRKTPALLP